MIHAHFGKIILPADGNNAATERSGDFRYITVLWAADSRVRPHRPFQFTVSRRPFSPKCKPSLYTSRTGTLWVKNGPDAIEMGCLRYPRKQTSVRAAAMTDPDPSPLFADGCTVIACYGDAKPTDTHLASTIQKNLG